MGWICLEAWNSLPRDFCRRGTHSHTKTSGRFSRVSSEGYFQRAPSFSQARGQQQYLVGWGHGGLSSL